MSNARGRSRRPTPSAIASRRLHNQSLAAPRFAQPADAVGWLGAVQAQDYAMAKWALGLRVANATDAGIEKAFNHGRILRTHVLRPTWHFVSPEDICWMLELTAPRVKAILSHYDRKLGLTATVLSRCHATMAKALDADGHLTREELARCLERKRIEARGQRLARIVMHAELDGLVCSGPRRGKQFTYALLERRVRKAARIDREEARAKLALRYFVSHGPAQLKDFAWWSGLTVKDAADGLESVKSQLARETLDGKTYWSSLACAPKEKPTRSFLLSIYDEYTIAYKDRSALGGDRFAEMFLRMGNALTAVLVVDGKIAGTWKRAIGKNTVDVVVRPLRRLSSTEKKAVAVAADRYGAFLGVPTTTIRWSTATT